MQDETEAPQGLPEGEPVAPTPAPEPSETGTETPQPEASAEGQETTETEGEEGTEQPKKVPWFQRRIDDLTRKRWEAERKAEALEAQLAATRYQPTDQAQPDQYQQPQQQRQDPRMLSPSEVERLATERAEQIAAKKEFDKQCNEVYDKGRKQFGDDFETSLRNFQMLGGLPPALIEAALESGAPEKVLYSLGNNMDEASRLMSLPPIRMAAAVAKMAAGPAPKPISKAPAPIKPIGGGGNVATDPDTMSIDQWMKWHDSQQAKRQRA